MEIVTISGFILPDSQVDLLAAPTMSALVGLGSHLDSIGALSSVDPLRSLATSRALKVFWR